MVAVCDVGSYRVIEQGNVEAQNGVLMGTEESLVRVLVHALETGYVEEVLGEQPLAALDQIPLPFAFLLIQKAQ